MASNLFPVARVNETIIHVFKHLKKSGIADEDARVALLIGLFVLWESLQRIVQQHNRRQLPSQWIRQLQLIHTNGLKQNGTYCCMTF